MIYHVPQGEAYNPKARELYFIMGDDGIAYPAKFKLIDGEKYLKKIGTNDQNYYYFGGDYKYALAINTEYNEPNGGFYVAKHEIYFKSEFECESAYKKRAFIGFTPDGGKILKIDYGMYNNFFDW